MEPRVTDKVLFANEFFFSHRDIYAVVRPRSKGSVPALGNSPSFVILA